RPPETKEPPHVGAAPQGDRARNPKAGHPPHPPPKATPPPALTPASSSVAPAAPTAPAVGVQNAAPAAHNHAPNTPQTNTAQAPAAAQTAAPASQAGSNVGTPALIAGGDPAAGRLVFRKCQVCHSLEPGKDILGPSLAGVFGRKSGAAPNYAYSPAMKDANLTWDAKTLDAYLDDPQKIVPGNKMPFPGLKTSQDRSDVIAYMAALPHRSRRNQARHRLPDS